MPVENQGDIPWYEWPLRWLGAFVNAVIPSITAYAPGPEDPEVQKYHAKKRLELKPGDKVPDSEDETRKIVKEKFRNDSKKWLESIPRNVKLPELPKEPDWNSIGWDKLKGTDPETTILRRWILSKFIDYKNSKYYNPKALSPETLKQIELIETKELDRIAHELYRNLHPATATVGWAMLGRVALMVGGATVAVLVSGGTLAPVAGAAIMGGAGLVVGGGMELANQVQSGGAINPGAIATRTAFGGVKGALWGLAPELGAVGFGASIGGYSAVENLTYNATKGKTTASDSIEAIAGGLGEGLFAGIMHKASSKAANKAPESVPAKPEPIKPMTEAELEKVSGGAKDPGWRPNTKIDFTKIDTSSLKMTEKVKSHFHEFARKTQISEKGVTTQFKGESSRPYVQNGTNSILNEIINAKSPVPDPRGVPNAFRWDVPGMVNGKSGIWELIINTDTNTIIHFLFNTKR